MARIACWLACAAALALPALALGGSTGDYAGGIKSDEVAGVSFEVIKKPSGRLGVRKFTVKDAPTTCGGTSDTTSYGFAGYFSLHVDENGRFHVKDSPSGFRDESLIVVKGKLKHHGRASGWLRVVDDFDVVGVCDTGRLDWTARK